MSDPGPPLPLVPPGQNEPFQCRHPCVVTELGLPTDIQLPTLPPPGPLPLTLPERAGFRAERISERRFTFWSMGSASTPPLTRIRLTSSEMVHDTEPGAANRMRMAPFTQTPPESPAFVDNIPGITQLVVECDPPPPWGDHFFELFRSGKLTDTVRATTVEPAFPLPTSSPMRIAAIGSGIVTSDEYAHLVFTAVVGRAEPWMLRNVDVLWVDRGLHRSTHDGTATVRDAASYKTVVLNLIHQGWMQVVVSLGMNYPRNPERFVLRLQQHDGTLSGAAFTLAPDWPAWSDKNRQDVYERRLREDD